MQAARGATIAERGVIGPWAARRLILLIAVAGLAVDQLAKALVVAKLDPQDPVRLLGGLVTLQLIRNSGAAFSLGENVTVVFAVLAVVALVAVSVWMVPKVRVRTWAVATGLLLAGIAGNLADRLFRAPGPFRGHVVDFIQLPHFAIFNVADMCLTCAAAIIVVLAVAGGRGIDGRLEGRAATKVAEPSAPAPGE